MVDPAGLRRTSSGVLGVEVNLRTGESAGRIRDFVIGPNGVIEFVVAELDDVSYLIPYDAARIDMDERTMSLGLSPKELVRVPSFVGTMANLEPAEYRQRLFEAWERATIVWGLRVAAREHSVAKPIVPPETTETAAKSAANEQTPSAPGLPVLAQPQAPTQTVIRTETVSPQPSEAPAPAAAPPANSAIATPVIIAPSAGRFGARTNVAPGNQAQGRSTSNGTFAPTSSVNNRFPSVTAPRSPASTAPRTSTLGNAPTLTGPNNPQPTGTQPRTNQPTAAQAPVVTQPVQIPGAGTSTTTSPSGTRFPARVP
jgi:hypothetical protein